MVVISAGEGDGIHVGNTDFVGRDFVLALCSYWRVSTLHTLVKQHNTVMHNSFFLINYLPFHLQCAWNRRPSRDR